MFDHFQRVGVLVLSTAFPVVAGVAISDDHLAVVAAFAAGVAAIVGALTWLDARMQSKIDAHAKEEARLDEERHARTLFEIRAMLAEHSIRER